MERCATETPYQQEVRPDHFVACHLYGAAEPMPITVQ
jgi:hypothetical protein